MRSANFYPGLTIREKNAKKHGFARTLLLAGFLMLALPFAGWADPTFAHTPTYAPPAICGGYATNIGPWLQVIDPVPGHIDSLLIVGDASHGTLGGFDIHGTIPSGGSGIPTGLTYTPFPNATADTFLILVKDNIGGAPNPIVIYVTINPGPSLTLGTVNPVCAGVTNAVLPFSGLTNVGPDTAIFNFTGAPQAFTVPANVLSVMFDLRGASGGNDNISGTPNPGRGGRVQGTLSVIPAQTLNIVVGGVGGDGTVTGGVGGYNGGGNSQFYFFGAGGAGGGATDIRVGGTALGNRRVVAGGGAGNGADNASTPDGSFIGYAGGNGGGITGGSSENNSAGSHASGGNAVSGGAPAFYPAAAPAAAGTSGNGGAGSTTGISGGGGGGYFGGGGGIWTGGGGGSSYTNSSYVTGVTHTQGANTGDGVATIYYNIPGTYNVIWDTAAIDSGFENRVGLIVPNNDQFNLSVPPAVSAGTYGGTITLSNGTCTSPGYHFTFTVKPVPVVNTVADQIVCNGDSTADITFSSDVPGGEVYYVNDNSGIGLASSGSGHISSFAPINTTSDPVIANITITPQANGCIGNSQTFHIIDNPKPVLNSTLTPERICNGQIFSYVPTSLTTGTGFDYSRAAITGIANPAQSGSNNPNESLLNTSTNAIDVVYVYTLTANGCTNSQNVTVQVNPTPVLTSSANPPAVCSNQPFTYHATSSTAAAVLTYSRAAVTGISNAAATGTGDINETLINTTSSPVTVNYVYSMNINGCITTQNVSVMVNPTPSLSSSLNAGTLCSGNLFTYDATSSVSGTTIRYTRAAVAGITPATGSGTNGFSENLVNTTPNPIAVQYIFTDSANGCTSTQTVTATVNPSPSLTNSLTPPGICTNTEFDYTAATLTPGTTIMWARDSVQGISNTPRTGTGSVHEILYSVADTAVHVTYLYTLTANGCPHSQAVVVVVNPLPRLSNNVSSLSVCDSALFSFTPTSNTVGATFSYTRPYQAGVTNLSSSGTNSPNEYLDNNTYITVEVPYIYTISAAGCSNTQSIIVSVRPSPVLSKTTAVACANTPFTFTPISYTTATDYRWSRASVAGITPATKSGTGSITDTLYETGTAPVNVVYVYTLTVSGTVCSNVQRVTVTVNPAPSAPVIATHPGVTLCGNATAVNFGADAPAAAGYTYSWSATNATVLATGNDGQYSIIDFNTVGDAVVTLTSHIENTSCTASSSYTVTVTGGEAIPVEVIYFNENFICRQTQVSSYQWGYDDANTLDSTVLVGETNQNYHNANPDISGRRYWVITVHNGCMQKTYYNKPTGVDDINAVAGIKVYPNPANNFVNVEISSLVKGDINVEVTNMLGQKISSVAAVNNKAQVSVAGLPAGCYLVDCFSDGVKIAASRFIKN